MKKKRCPGCRRELLCSRTYWYSNRSAKDGLSAKCKDCTYRSNGKPMRLWDELERVIPAIRCKACPKIVMGIRALHRREHCSAKCAHAPLPRRRTSSNAAPRA